MVDSKENYDAIKMLGVKGSIQGMLVKTSLANMIVLLFLMEMVSKEMHQG